ncbi:alpha/beta hydrolase [Ferruginibacter paludis]|uniref:alpha/beta fold hydrolase n=1 Tax=Ferruginibacter paludis TaxID=1310417 RepID=UPI0025B3864F|nr:alpha/beta hydrolase [Ferruginibacter paludis]MDN3658161.1 alpha/beta hydrolase [Ferruginibacter paludis]
MKSLFFIVLNFLLLHTYGQQQRPKQLRHFMQSVASPANAIQYGNNPKTGHYATVGDAKIYYEVYGKGKPLVIFHGGIFGSTYEMHQFIDSLSKKYQVIAVSTRGHGKSYLGTEAITYEQKANDVMAVINAVTKDSVIVLGFSDGGYAGYKLASMYPGTVKKLIAIGATELYPRLRNFSFDVQQAVALDSVYWKQQYNLMPEPQRLQEMFTKLGSMYNKLTLDSAFFQTIQCPTLVMAGDKDGGNPPQRVVHTAQMIPHSLVGVIPNCGHGVFLENFPAVWACVVPFLKQ